MIPVQQARRRCVSIPRPWNRWKIATGQRESPVERAKDVCRVEVERRIPIVFDDNNPVIVVRVARRERKPKRFASKKRWISWNLTELGTEFDQEVRFSPQSERCTRVFFSAEISEIPIKWTRDLTLKRLSAGTDEPGSPLLSGKDPVRILSSLHLGVSFASDRRPTPSIRVDDESYDASISCPDRGWRSESVEQGSFLSVLQSTGRGWSRSNHCW